MTEEAANLASKTGGLRAAVSSGRPFDLFREGPVARIAELGRTAEGLMAIATFFVSVGTWIVDRLKLWPAFVPYSYDVLVIATLGSALCTFVFFTRLRRTRQSLRKMSEKAEKAHEEYFAATQQLAALESVREPFRTFASVNALCDKEMFERFNAILLDGANTKYSIGLALAEVHANIQFILQSTCEILGAYTGHRCAASVKVISRWDSGDHLSEARLKSIYRDPASRADRGKNDEIVYGVLDNTAIEEVLLKGKRVWACDNLRALGDRYKNSRTGWQHDYNATIAVPVKAFELNEAGVECRGVFFADAHEGGFDNEICAHFMREISWRLAVMLYRQERLKAIDKELSAGTRETRVSG